MSLLLLFKIAVGAFCVTVLFVIAGDRESKWGHRLYVLSRWVCGTSWFLMIVLFILNVLMGNPMGFSGGTHNPWTGDGP